MADLYDKQNAASPTGHRHTEADVMAAFIEPDYMDGWMATEVDIRRHAERVLVDGPFYYLFDKTWT